MKRIFVMVMLIMAVGLVGCPRYYDGGRDDRNRGHDDNRDRDNRDRGHDSDHGDRGHDSRDDRR